MNPASTLAEPAHGGASSCAGACRCGLSKSALLLVAAIFFALHFVHLKADFPNHSPWDGLVEVHRRGLVRGCSDPALPVGSLECARGLQSGGGAAGVARDRDGGVSRYRGEPGRGAGAYGGGVRADPGVLVALIAACGALNSQAASVLAPAIAVLLLAVNPFCYAFTRLAILEPLLILLTLAALLVARGGGQATAMSADGVLDGAAFDAARLLRWVCCCR